MRRRRSRRRRGERGFGAGFEKCTLRNFFVEFLFDVLDDGKGGGCLGVGIAALR